MANKVKKKKGKEFVLNRVLVFTARLNGLYSGNYKRRFKLNDAGQGKRQDLPFFSFFGGILFF